MRLRYLSFFVSHKTGEINEMHFAGGTSPIEQKADFPRFPEQIRCRGTDSTVP